MRVRVCPFLFTFIPTLRLSNTENPRVLGLPRKINKTVIEEAKYTSTLGKGSCTHTVSVSVCTHAHTHTNMYAPKRFISYLAYNSVS